MLIRGMSLHAQAPASSRMQTDGPLEHRARHQPDEAGSVNGGNPGPKGHPIHMSASESEDYDQHIVTSDEVAEAREKAAAAAAKYGGSEHPEPLFMPGQVLWVIPPEEATEDALSSTDDEAGPMSAMGPAFEVGGLFHRPRKSSQRLLDLCMGIHCLHVLIMITAIHCSRDMMELKENLTERDHERYFQPAPGLIWGAKRWSLAAGDHAVCGGAGSIELRCHAHGRQCQPGGRCARARETRIWQRRGRFLWPCTAGGRDPCAYRGSRQQRSRREQHQCRAAQPRQQSGEENIKGARTGQAAATLQVPIDSSICVTSLVHDSRSI